MTHQQEVHASPAGQPGAEPGTVRSAEPEPPGKHPSGPGRALMDFEPNPGAPPRRPTARRAFLAVILTQHGPGVDKFIEDRHR